MVACSNQVEELFQESANERVKAVIVSCATTLKAAPYGWTMDYTTPVGFQSNLVLQFADSNRVSIYADFEELISESSYSFNYSQGPILSFDTYSQLHLLADPQVQPLGFGLEGDFEFVIMSVSPDSIVLNGRKNRDRVVLHKAQNGAIQKIRLVKQLNVTVQTQNSFFHKLDVNGNLCDIMLSADLKQLEFQTADGKNRSEISYTENGFSLVNPFQLGGETVQNFTWDAATKSFKMNGLYAITETNIPTFSVGATANELIGFMHVVVGSSYALAIPYYEVATLFTQYLRSEIFLNVPTKITTITRSMVNGETVDTKQSEMATKISYAFVFNKVNAGDTWNNFNGKSITFPREDKILIPTGTRDGEESANLNYNTYSRQIATFLFNSTGLTVFSRDSVSYLISTKDSKKWIKLKKSDITTPEQVKYINF